MTESFKMVNIEMKLGTNVFVNTPFKFCVDLISFEPSYKF